MELSFLKQAMERLGFSDKRVALILNCVSIPTFSVIINGIAKGLTQPGRGLCSYFSYSPFPIRPFPPLWYPCRIGYHSDRDSPTPIPVHYMYRGVFKFFVAGRKAMLDSLVEIF